MEEDFLLFNCHLKWFPKNIEQLMHRRTDGRTDGQRTVANIYKRKKNYLFFNFWPSYHHHLHLITLRFSGKFWCKCKRQSIFVWIAGKQADLHCLFSSIIVTNKFVKVINDSEMRQSIASTLVFVLFCK